MTDADEIKRRVFDQMTDVASACRAQRAKRQCAFVDIGYNFAMPKAEDELQFFLELDAAGDRPFNKDADQPFVARLGDKAMRLGIGNAEDFRHFALRLASGEMQPRGARREGRFPVELQCRALVFQPASHCLNFFA
jgi:hypothetical protein